MSSHDSVLIDKSMNNDNGIKTNLRVINAYRRGNAGPEHALAAVDFLLALSIPGFDDDLSIIREVIDSGDLEKISRRKIKANLKRLELKYSLYKIQQFLKHH
ncbi:MAG: hypothetical protein ACK4NR_12110 [Micavibrio sp.]